MSRYYTLDGGEPSFLASTSGWGAFQSWTEHLDSEDAPDLLHLVDHGWDQDMRAIHSQLTKAIAQHPPATDTLAVAQSLLYALSQAGDVITITDGLGPSGGSESFAEDEPRLLDVPDIAQPDGYSCGAASAMAVGRYYGVGPTDIADWKKLLGTDPDAGTPPEAIIRVLRSLGLHVEARQNMTLTDLRQCWREGKPVICPVQDYGPDAGPDDWDDGHYVTVVGVSLGLVFVQDSMEDVELEGANSDAAPGRVMIDQEKWMEVWHDEGADGTRYERYGIIVSRS